MITLLYDNLKKTDETRRKSLTKANINVFGKFCL